MQSSNQDRIVEIIAGSGWGGIHLGDSADQVRQALADAQIGHSEEYDPYCWELDDPSCTLQFLAVNPPRLTQIAFNTELAQYQGHPLVGLSLAEALLTLRIRSYADTLWSAVDLDSEYTSGVPLADSKRIAHCDPKTLVDGGTLWIKSLGIGLCTNLGVVSEVVLRQPADVPTVGCGPANEVTIMAASTIDQSPAMTTAKPAANYRKSSFFTKTKGIVRVILGLFSLVFIALPIFIAIRDIQSWQEAKSVVGVVISTKPEGPFPDEVVVEYTLPDTTKNQVTLSTNYTIAREVGNEVDLIYRPDSPERAMTRIQARDEGFSISPYWLFGSVGLGTFCLAWAFPNHLRRNGRRS